MKNAAWREISFFEYDIVRLGKRIDVILLIRHMVFSLEFKNGKNILIFDEAQRVWNQEKMSRKHDDPAMAVSEPHLLFSIMDRHQDWAVMICLVGLGQDIYDGEVGINEWFRCGVEDYPEWEMYYSPEIFSQVEDKNIDREMIEGR